MVSRVFSLYKLHFTAPLHISDSRDDYGVSLTTYSSDAMYAALTASLAKLGETIPNDGDIGCCISSFYPYYQESDKDVPVFFFPKPLAMKMPLLSDPTPAKKIKKVCWLDKSCMELILNGQSLFKGDECVGKIDRTFLSERGVDPGFICSEVSERATVSRCGEDAAPFYMDRVYFSGHSGLFFLVDGDTSAVDRAMPLLALEGIGTDRTVGNGLFEYEKARFEISVPDESEYGVCLSTFIPENKEQLERFLNDSDSAYDLSRRGGWITSEPYLGLRKNAIYVFNPGSVFKSAKNGMGRIVDLSPAGLCSHPIWRCGKAIVLPYKND